MSVHRICSNLVCGVFFTLPVCLPNLVKIGSKIKIFSLQLWFPGWSRQPGLGRGPLRAGRLPASPRLPGRTPGDGRQGAQSPGHGTGHDNFKSLNLSFHGRLARNLACDWHEIWHASYLYPSDIVAFVIFWQVIRRRLGRVPLTPEVWSTIWSTYSPDRVVSPIWSQPKVTHLCINIQSHMTFF